MRFYQAYVANAQGTIHVSVNILICTLQPVQQQVKICVSECTYMFWGDLTSLILSFFFLSRIQGSLGHPPLAAICPSIRRIINEYQQIRIVFLNQEVLQSLMNALKPFP